MFFKPNPFFRLDIVNNRLDIIRELYDMLNNELHHQHENKLEIIIIGILIIEITIEIFWNILFKDILGIVGGENC